MRDFRGLLKIAGVKKLTTVDMMKKATYGISRNSALNLLKTAQTFSEDGSTFTLSPGQTLSHVVRLSGKKTTVADIIKANKGLAANRYRAGVKYILPESARAFVAQKPIKKFVKDSPNPRSKHIATGEKGKYIVTYPQGSYTLPEGLDEQFKLNLATQLALEAGPHASPEEIQAIYNVAVNRSSGNPDLIPYDLSSSAWASRPKSNPANKSKPNWGRPELLNDKGYKKSIDGFINLIDYHSKNQEPTTTDHTLFRHTKTPYGELPKFYASYPSALTATNVFNSVSGPSLVTYKNEAHRHGHYEEEKPAKKQK